MEKKMILQAFERRGNIGIFWYGHEDSEEHTWEKRVHRFRGKPVTRSKKECMEEQKRMLRLGVYEDSTDNTVRH